MMIFRSAEEKDLIGIHQLASHSGLGITTLPKNLDILEKRLAWSCDSFKKKVQQARNEYYLFVMEESTTGTVVGTSAIEAASGFDVPFYSYHLSRRTHISHELNIRTDYEVLALVNDYQGFTEICTLYLEPNSRQNHNGLLLSRGRFLFMAQFPHRFTDRVFAEMRGISDEKGDSPFWNAIGKHFFHMSFPEADRLTLYSNKQFIADLMPRNPIYASLLPPSAQEVIGQPHPSSVAAMTILTREGFHPTQYVDIFDAGPTIEAPFKQIRTLANSQLFTVRTLMDEVESTPYLIANTHIAFRSLLSTAILHEDNGCTLSKETAELLKLTKGDSVRLVPLH